jgi:hypothetical protein
LACYDLINDNGRTARFIAIIVVIFLCITLVIAVFMLALLHIGGILPRIALPVGSLGLASLLARMIVRLMRPKNVPDDSATDGQYATKHRPTRNHRPGRPG